MIINSEKVNRGVHTSNTGTQYDQLPNIIDNVRNFQNCVGDGNQMDESLMNHDKITNESQLTSTEPLSETTETSELYKMKALARKGKSSPEKIEFKLHKKSRLKRNYFVKKPLIKSPRCCHRYHYQFSNLANKNHNTNEKQNPNEISCLQRLLNSLSKMASRTPEQSPTEFGIEIETEASDIQKLRTDRMDIYYFDHGNSAYFRTTDCPPAILSELLAQQTTHYATRFWAEIFGSIHIGVTFFVTFFLQAYRFLLHSIIRPILVGFFQMTSDYFLKPMLTVIFNGFLQPPLILFYNLFCSIRDMLEPIAGTIDNFLRPIANVFRSIRFVTFGIRQKDSKEKNAKIKENV